MSNITFIDTEFDPNSKKLLDKGGLSYDGNKFHSPSFIEFKEFLQPAEFLCGPKNG